ncbi:sigma-54 dependent transcriptional regulator [Chitinophaga filiformis]|uniref:sigma-54-dependent transcriptional regulator n=1 Tax=Chitinophaga filiformis TaxID=104663 RepID=UPI001F2D6CF6|nr:sigma-54 dependent transcriptional regulator [Chitinophaga filiformis]MCF6402857.1 sigma-54 dependent transcriptional regulator [Chitinophaga filiformis]MCF6403225.1 sigma-54 dependent transcriptional regulator [Chitinophaga filiformis]
MKTKILIVEDMFVEAHALERTLLGAGYEVYPVATTVKEALAILDHNPVDMVLLDIFLKGDLTGIDLAHQLNQRGVAFIYLSASSNKAVLEQAKATHPYGFLVKPFRKTDVLVTMDVAWYLHLHKRHTPKPDINRSVSTGVNLKEAHIRPCRIVGDSEKTKELIEQIRIAASSGISVLILGETGTGKELVAREIHEQSSRRDKPFITVNCGGIPASLVEAELFGHERGAFTGAQTRRIGKFEQADGGTIFLDEIGELPIDLQSKFLRVLQEKEIEPIGGKLKKINVRVLAATNRHLEDEISKGRFRIDLYYRLSVFPLLVPPLRERNGDIPLLAEHFIKRYAQELDKPMTGITDGAMEQLLKYDWPGNIRELENVIFRSVLISPGAMVDRLPMLNTKAAETEAENLSMSAHDRNHILKVLGKCNWKVAGKNGAAAMLDLKVSTLTSRMKKLGIVRPR